MIAPPEGLLKPELATDKDRYNNAVEAWFRYRHNSATSRTAKLADGFTQLCYMRALFGAKDLDENSFVTVESIAAVAVWDTVGSIGIPVEGLGVDVADYDGTALSLKVNVGLHAVSLDEQRKSVVPALWTAADNVTQILFPGGIPTSAAAMRRRDWPTGH